MKIVLSDYKVKKIKAVYEAKRAEYNEAKNLLDKYHKENGAYITDESRRLNNAKEQIMSEWKAMEEIYVLVV